ncbi:hypothetical protein EDC04DRAFT_2599069 [Pisolithus marmoratus]|nr:hypothetical protein EDC04DRAFT_2599069 [Pisolithus marmoratus]
MVIGHAPGWIAGLLTFWALAAADSLGTASYRVHLRFKLRFGTFSACDDKRDFGDRHSKPAKNCIQVAEHNTGKMIIEEVFNGSHLEKLCMTRIATTAFNRRALQLAAEGIRPVLPLIRNTPYGKRIQNKLQRERADNCSGGAKVPRRWSTRTSVIKPSDLDTNL